MQIQLLLNNRDLVEERVVVSFWSVCVVCVVCVQQGGAGGRVLCENHPAWTRHHEQQGHGFHGDRSVSPSECLTFTPAFREPHFCCHGNYMVWMMSQIPAAFWVCFQFLSLWNSLIMLNTWAVHVEDHQGETKTNISGEKVLTQTKMCRGNTSLPVSVCCTRLPPLSPEPGGGSEAGVNESENLLLSCSAVKHKLWRSSGDDSLDLTWSSCLESALMWQMMKMKYDVLYLCVCRE